MPGLASKLLHARLFKRSHNKKASEINDSKNKNKDEKNNDNIDQHINDDRTDISTMGNCSSSKAVETSAHSTLKSNKNNIDDSRKNRQKSFMNAKKRMLMERRLCETSERTCDTGETQRLEDGTQDDQYDSAGQREQQSFDNDDYNEQQEQQEQEQPLSGGSADEQRRIAPSKLRPGYSSGGSSVSSGDEREQCNGTAGCHYLSDWKHELAADGDLCKGVVRIEPDFGRPIDEVYEGVHDGKVLGSGATGLVRKVKHRQTGVEYAVKCLDLGLIQDHKGIRDEAALQALREEIFIMCQLDHPNIVRLEEVYESELEIYLIQELCHGGDLFDRLDQQPDEHYSEAKCARLVKQMLSSVRYLHSKNIIHRDLKLENFLFSTRDADPQLNLIDFGLSKHFAHTGELHCEAVGTPYTAAPEIIRGQYDEKVDIWALGVITFLLLSGETPFGGIDGEQLCSVRRRILECELNFYPTDLWQHVSDDGKAFVKRLLNPNVKDRPTAREAQLDPWLQKFGKKNSSETACERKLSPKVAQALVQFKEYSDMRKLLYEVLSFTLLPEQIEDLRTDFESIDTDGDGEISLAALRQVLMQSAEAGTLGALTEGEVNDIFNAMRVRKCETKIRWHEFIAAGLSQCDFDERNLRLAFDRLDYDHKGYITLDDMNELLGASREWEGLCSMWEDCIAECACTAGKITYEHFRMFLKGQQQQQQTLAVDSTEDDAVAIVGTEPRSPIRRMSSLRRSMAMEGSGSLSSSSSFLMLTSVPELTVSPQQPRRQQMFPNFEGDDDDKQKQELLASMPILPTMPTTTETSQIATAAADDDGPGTKMQRARSKSLETPATIVWVDDDDDSVAHCRSPVSGVVELSQQQQQQRVVLPLTPKKRGSVILLPTQSMVQELQHVIQDESSTPLVVNRALYRKHREFRNSVLEASKIFDKKRHEREQQILLSSSSSMQKRQQGQEQDEGHSTSRVAGTFTKRASLVMKHGAYAAVGSRNINSSLSMRHLQVSNPTEATADIASTVVDDDNDDDIGGNDNNIMNKSNNISTSTSIIVQQASRRSGRPQRTATRRRQKHRTASDISGMLR